MRILVVNHDVSTYAQTKKKMRWTRLPYLFGQLGHDVRVVGKHDWWKYPFTYLRFKPDVVISAGKIAGLITGAHHLLPWKKKAVFVHDLTDHFSMYKSEKRIWFLRNNHDYVTVPTMYNMNKFNCHDYVPNGSDFEVMTGVSAFNEKEYDAVYIGQTHSLYNISGLKENCDRLGLKLLILTNVECEKLPEYLNKCKIAVYPISWDSSVKMYDYAALGMPVVAPKPNLAEGVGYPAYYCEDLGIGIKYLIDNPEEAVAIGSGLRSWFDAHSGKWEVVAKKYLRVLDKYMGRI